jgi:hypothetical protein
VVQTPSITRLTVEGGQGDFLVASRGTNGDRVRIIGADFGSRQGDSQVSLVINGQTLTMPVASWSDERIVVRVPNNAPAGAGNVRVNKGGGRLLSNSVEFTVFKAITISNAMLQGVVTALGLDQTAIRLDNGANASSITFSPQMAALGVSNRSFSLATAEARLTNDAKIAASIVIPFGTFPERIRYFVNNVNSNSVSLSISGGQLVLRIGFESAGSEIEGELRYCILSAFGVCATTSEWQDGGAPDVQVNNASVVIRFTPAASGGSLIFSSASASFDADFQVGGDWEDWLVNLVTNYRNRVRPAVSDALTRAANRAAVRRAMGSALMSALRSQGVNRVTSVSANGANIIVRFE